MIKGLGIDVVEVSRIERALENPRFLLRILTENELQSPMTTARIAGRWAAKEAVAKAIPQIRRWHEVEVENDAEGKPAFVFQNPPEGIVHLSISHERGIACAVVVWERP
ncbi:MAG: holo-ACP synthase [Armatimonadetes bacterium]|nr:holo-ACP synthase [Armatimonadota bacterium]